MTDKEYESPINFDSIEYQKKNGKWYMKGKFLDILVPKNEMDIPDEVKREWERRMRKQKKRNENPKPTKMSKNMPSENRIASMSKSHINPIQLSSARQSCSQPISKTNLQTDTVKKHLYQRTSTSKSSAKPTQEEFCNGITVTDSQQLIRPLKAELKAQNPVIGKEFLNRIELRKKIVGRHVNEQIKPFEPKKRTLNAFWESRDETCRKFSTEAEEIVSKLERIKTQRSFLTTSTTCSKDVKSVANELMTLQSKARNVRCFGIDDLTNFADGNGVMVLNLGKFICATDKRNAIYNEKNSCIFCKVHGKASMNHPSDTDCPYIYCVCAQCYWIGKLSNMKTS